MNLFAIFCLKLERSLCIYRSRWGGGMAKRNKNRMRLKGLHEFSKSLVRRCAAHCELCDAKGVKLTPCELPPLADEPDFEHCLLLCDQCCQQMLQPDQLDVTHWYGLSDHVWSSIPAVKIASLLMLARLKAKEQWAARIMEQVYLNPEELSWYRQAQTVLDQ